MAPNYKVTYFNVTALTEPIRFLFNYGQIEFEDNRFEKEAWPSLKSSMLFGQVPIFEHNGKVVHQSVAIARYVAKLVKLVGSMPFGQVPIFEHNGKVVHQSIAIARYVAKLVKLVGSNDWEDLEIDSAVDTVNDLRQKIAVYHYENDPVIKEQRKIIVFNEVLPYYLEKLEKQVINNNGYLACSKLTWADLYFVALLDYIKFMIGKDLLEGSPALQQLKNKVLSLPTIKAWIEKRPKTEF